MAKISNNAERWQIAKDCIIDGADSGATIDQIKYALNLSYGYVPLSNIRQVLDEEGYTRQKNKTWSKEHE